MSEFVGRTGSLRVYSYPESRRGAGVPSEFARNYAAGAKGTVTIPGGGLQVTWNHMDVGPGNDEDVPITPIATGVVLVSGVLTIDNPTGAAIVINVTVQVDDAPIVVPFAESTVLASGGRIAIPFLVETDVLSPLNATYQIEVFVTGAGAVLAINGAVLNIQEVAVATG